MASKVIKPGDRFPWYESVFGTAIHEYKDQRGTHEARVIWLRLPSWGFGFDLSWDQERWGQRVLVYHGHRGLSLHWRFSFTVDLKVSNR